MLDSFKRLLLRRFSSATLANPNADCPKFNATESSDLHSEAFDENVTPLFSEFRFSSDRNSYPQKPWEGRERLMDDPQVVDLTSNEMYYFIKERNQEEIKDVELPDGTIVTVEQQRQFAEQFLEEVLIPGLKK